MQHETRSLSGISSLIWAQTTDKRGLWGYLGGGGGTNSRVRVTYTVRRVHVNVAFEAVVRPYLSASIPFGSARLRLPARVPVCLHAQTDRQGRPGCNQCIHPSIHLGPAACLRKQIDLRVCRIELGRQLSSSRGSLSDASIRG
mmetsp:Transcript_13123/g.25805  ORF Transcript_13123/g.25805 Transcript_13123/m.25805 type:complete len:143 (+) Transcript_13123:215-643(+)